MDVIALNGECSSSKTRHSERKLQRPQEKNSDQRGGEEEEEI